MVRRIDWELELTPELGRNNLETMLEIKRKRMVEETTPDYEIYKRLEIVACEAKGNRPYLPQLRPEGYFKVGDEVAEFVFERESFVTCEVSFVDYLGYVSTTGGGKPSYYNSFWVTPLKDFNYLREDPDFRNFWLDFSRPIIAHADDVMYAWIFGAFEITLRRESGETDFVIKRPRKIGRVEGIDDC